MIKFLFYPISFVYSAIVFLREIFYKYGILKSHKILGAKVISIGNLTFGGTGKTPIINFLVQTLKNQTKIAILSRGYGRKTHGFLKVEPHIENATETYGDEPVLIAKNFSDVPVFVCEDRVQGCLNILKECRPDLILLDDGFQHLKIKKDVDIVVLDGTARVREYNYPPAGRLRSAFRYLSRANAIFITKTNFSDEKSLRFLNKSIDEAQNKYGAKIPVFLFETHIDCIVRLNSMRENKKEISQDKSEAESRHYDLLPQLRSGEIKEIGLVSAIGNPKNFEDSIRSLGNFKISKHLIFSDHYRYNRKIADILLKESKNKTFITTEKDAVKLLEIYSDLDAESLKNLYVSKLKMQSKESVGEIVEIVLDTK